METIFALASGPGRAGVAVYRLSGPLAGPVLTTLMGKLPLPRQACRAQIMADGEQIDDGLVLWFPAPRSFTGEDVAELHLHGGRAIAKALAAALVNLGLRPAEPGEFSRRAVVNGKFDLTRAEAIADLVDAETAAQRRQALRQLAGGLEQLVEGWRSRLVASLAHLEAVIDFADEDIPDTVLTHAAQSVHALASDMEGVLADNHQGERLRDGLSIAIIGAPNAGKSSLLNRIAGRDAAIVSATAGTTRDVIEVHLDLGGWPVILADTAGLRDAAEDIEAEGIRRAIARAEAADLRLTLFDSTQLPAIDSTTEGLVGQGSLVVFNKIDQAHQHPPSTLAGQSVFSVSALTGEGIETLLAALEQQVAGAMEGASASPFTRERHRVAVMEAVQSLRRFDPNMGSELAAEDLRMAGRALGRVTGRIDVEELLDVVFRDFCIGK